MTSDEVLTLLRRRLGEVDPTISEYQDAHLLDALKNARRTLSIKRVPLMDTITIVSDEADPAYGISPDPDDMTGSLLVLRAAVDMLRDAYIGMTQRGEFGVIWRSGMEEESSVEASKKYAGLIDTLDNELQQLLLINNRIAFATRPQ